MESGPLEEQGESQCSLCCQGCRRIWPATRKGAPAGPVHAGTPASAFRLQAAGGDLLRRPSYKAGAPWREAAALALCLHRHRPAVSVPLSSADEGTSLTASGAAYSSVTYIYGDPISK